MSVTAFNLRVDAAAEPYRAAGRYAWHFARGKLRHDPMFRHIADASLAMDGGRILDLGCGYGLVFSWLAAAPERRGHAGVEFHGMELRTDRVRAARRALAQRARIDCCDIREATLPRASLVVIMDVLLYMESGAQEQILENVADALEPGGMLLLREADRGAGARFHATEWSERFAGAYRGRLWQALHYRSVADWRAALARVGLSVDVQPMSAGTPFANMLYTARKP